MKDSQIEQLLALAAAKLNMSPSELKSAAQNGDTNAIFSKLDKKSAEKVQSVMNNKRLTDEIMKKFGSDGKK
ncbi:MAG: hypothetical protein E7525_01180 [Ruminococcaceae bacterium]|nr:hypothetical protein [Oscillospiraceae bacterium]